MKYLAKIIASVERYEVREGDSKETLESMIRQEYEWASKVRVTLVKKPDEYQIREPAAKTDSGKN